jgi:TRAP-type mannitol/chloroaromatic compound transport system permease small subunit
VIAKLLYVIDGISKILAYITMLLTGVLILVMSYEMVVRRFFNAPTLWAFDISYMLSGLIFVCAMAYTLQRNEHVRIDFLSSRMPLRVQHAVNLILYATLLLPALYILCVAGVDETWTAFSTGQVERVSPWSPRVWPYYLGITVGLCALFLQVIAEMIRHAMKMMSPGTQSQPAEPDTKLLAGTEL